MISTSVVDVEVLKLVEEVDVLVDVLVEKLVEELVDAVVEVDSLVLADVELNDVEELSEVEVLSLVLLEVELVL